MSDAREIVQPRWKRRATEIAEAIGGNSAGVSSVSLDQNTITELSQAIADAIDLKVLDINIKKYDDTSVSSVGIPIRSGISASSGGYLPIRVVTDVGDVVDTNVKQYNDVDVDARGLPVQAGRSISNNTLVPLVVNCPTINNFPSAGNTTFPSTMDVNIVKFGSGPNISASAHLPITGTVQCRQDVGSIRPWIVSTGTASGQVLGTWGATSVATTGTSLSQQDVETAMDNALANASGIAVQPALDANNVPIPLSVTGGNTTFPSTMDVNIARIGGGTNISPSSHLPVTESAPVTVQQVKIVGDETYGIIKTKNFALTQPTTVTSGNTFAPETDYNCVNYGLGADTTNTIQQGTYSSQTQNSILSYGWTIECNGVDILNQDLTHDLRGTTPTPGTGAQVGNQPAAYPLFIRIDSQDTVDKYHGRKVKLSSVANVWVLQPIKWSHGTVMGHIHHGVNSTSAYAWQIIDDNGGKHTNQLFLDNGNYYTGTGANRDKYIGTRVIRNPNNANQWYVVGIDAI